MNINSMQGFAQRCNGCGVCEAVCTSKAITMRADNEGFLFPRVDMNQCIDCGKCYSICPISNMHKTDEKQPIEVYACQAKDGRILIEATAGGLFPVLAQRIIQLGGTVYGAAYDNHMKVTHMKTMNMEGVARFNGSKYVQSDITKVLMDVRTDLQQGRRVLFSGTPCQVDAVKNLCCDICCDNLYTMDVVCYGVPSPALFESYLRSLEQKGKGKIIDYRFRDKHSNGWSHTTVIRMKDEQGTETVFEEEDYKRFPYYRMFAKRDCFRVSCYSCPYTNLNRCSDITTGNFWGIEKISSAFDAYQGVSMALINTDKGNELFQSVEDEMICEQRSIDDAVAANDALVKGVPFPIQREKIYRCYAKHGFDHVVKQYYTDNLYSFVRRVLGKVHRLLRKIL